MKIVYAKQKLKKSIFLAGPTPRSPEVPSWRPQAISLLNQLGFKGKVFVPEALDGVWSDNYDEQIQWEWEAINQSTVVTFWIPRELTNMPAFTTNVEFGMLAASGKIVLGSPNGSPKMRYLEALADRYGVPICETLQETIEVSYYKAINSFGI